MRREWENYQFAGGWELSRYHSNRCGGFATGKVSRGNVSCKTVEKNAATLKKQQLRKVIGATCIWLSCER